MAEPESRCRSLVSFSKQEIDQLLAEASKRGLKLATYIRTIVITHMKSGNVQAEPRRGAVSR